MPRHSTSLNKEGGHTARVVSLGRRSSTGGRAVHAVAPAGSDGVGGLGGGVLDLCVPRAAGGFLGGGLGLRLCSYCESREGSPSVGRASCHRPIRKRRVGSSWSIPSAALGSSSAPPAPHPPLSAPPLGAVWLRRHRERPEEGSEARRRRCGESRHSCAARTLFWLLAAVPAPLVPCCL